MKRIIICLIVVMVCNCEVYRVTNFRVSNEKIEETAEFILTCIKNGNPMSDEEGEDLVAQCDRTANDLFTEVSYKMHVSLEKYDGFGHIPRGRNSYILCDVAKGEQRRVCIEKGYKKNKQLKEKKND